MISNQVSNNLALIFSSIDGFDLIKWCLQESKLSAVCEKVMDRCLAPNTAGGEGCDNMTMILVQFKKTAESSATSSELKSEPSEEVQTVVKVEGD